MSTYAYFYLYINQSEILNNEKTTIFLFTDNCKHIEIYIKGNYGINKLNILQE